MCTWLSNQSDEDLEDFHTQLALSQRDDGSLSGSIQHELEFNSSDESERLAEGEIHSSILVCQVIYHPFIENIKQEVKDLMHI